MEKIEPVEMVKRLTAFIRSEGHFKNVSIENFRKMPGGASREIWSFDCSIDDGAGVRRRAMVLRRDPGAHKIDTSRRNEFMVIRAAFEESVPVPEVFWLSDDPAVLGAAFFIMERIDGETLARRLLRDDEYAKAREVMPAQLAEILAKIHRIDPAKHKLDFLAPADDAAALAEVKRYEQNYRTLAPSSSVQSNDQISRDAPPGILRKFSMLTFLKWPSERMKAVSRCTISAGSIFSISRYHSESRCVSRKSQTKLGAMADLLRDSVTEQIEAKDRKTDRESGRGSKMRRDQQKRAACVEHVAPTRRRRYRAEAEK